MHTLFNRLSLLQILLPGTGHQNRNSRDRQMEQVMKGWTPLVVPDSIKALNVTQMTNVNQEKPCLPPFLGPSGKGHNTDSLLTSALYKLFTYLCTYIGSTVLLPSVIHRARIKIT